LLLSPQEAPQPLKFSELLQFHTLLCKVSEKEFRWALLELAGLNSLHLLGRCGSLVGQFGLKLEPKGTTLAFTAAQCRLERPRYSDSAPAGSSATQQSPQCRPSLLAKPRRSTTDRKRTYYKRMMPHTVGGPLPVVARQGRERQKYGEDGARLVAGCIPVRYLPDVPGLEGVRVLMVSSRGGKGCVFPKGGWEQDESVEAAARRETVEEAGVRGDLEIPMIGTFAFRSGKSAPNSGKGRCIAYMFALSVSEELVTWPEVQQRQRAWCTIEEAYSKARYDWMRDALREWIKSKGWETSSLPENIAGRTLPPAPVATAAGAEFVGILPPHASDAPGVAVQT